MKRTLKFNVQFRVAIGILMSCSIAAGQEINDQHLLDGFKNPARWLTYSGDYTGQRHSPLVQITPANVHQLKVQWAFSNWCSRKIRSHSHCDRWNLVPDRT